MEEVVGGSGKGGGEGEEGEISFVERENVKNIQKKTKQNLLLFGGNVKLPPYRPCPASFARKSGRGWLSCECPQG